ncbi:hypothetical protein IF1G_09075 [Cordyceps javanica]|uniref:Uncharacterized protein n=1 Tax=Cordyceps javanica TaxID=43265 RepID=A0A545URD8_9HYPO|nr:hypothetical protein IF1G_09075 [Cordyceps javanica]
MLPYTLATLFRCCRLGTAATSWASLVSLTADGIQASHCRSWITVTSLITEAEKRDMSVFFIFNSDGSSSVPLAFKFPCCTYPLNKAMPDITGCLGSLGNHSRRLFLMVWGEFIVDWSGCPARSPAARALAAACGFWDGWRLRPGVHRLAFFGDQLGDHLDEAGDVDGGRADSESETDEAEFHDDVFLYLEGKEMVSTIW